MKGDEIFNVGKENERTEGMTYYYNRVNLLSVRLHKIKHVKYVFKMLYEGWCDEFIGNNICYEIRSVGSNSEHQLKS